MKRACPIFEAKFPTAQEHMIFIKTIGYYPANFQADQFLRVFF